jgi:hypothetical protein
VGYDAMSVDGVAAAARRQGDRPSPLSRRELARRGDPSIAASLEPPADSGDTLDDLRSLLGQALAIFRDRLASMLGTLLVRERDDPAPRLSGSGSSPHGSRWGGHRSGASPRRGASRVDVEAVIAILTGSLFAGHMLRADDAWLETIWRPSGGGSRADPRPAGDTEGSPPGDGGCRRPATTEAHRRGC